MLKPVELHTYNIFEILTFFKDELRKIYGERTQRKLTFDSEVGLAMPFRMPSMPYGIFIYYFYYSSVENNV